MSFTGRPLFAPLPKLYHSLVPDFGFIFDMDGVIADTLGPHARSWRRLAEELGLPFAPEDGAALLGRERGEALGVLLGDRPVEGAERAALLARKQVLFLEALGDFGPRDALPGVRELLAEARERGVPLGLASSSRNVGLILERLELSGMFDAVADGASVVHPKPAPDIFLWTAGRLGLSPARCVVFEDAAAGVRAALSGGFPVVGLGDPTQVGAARRVRSDLSGATVAEFALPWESTVTR